MVNIISVTNVPKAYKVSKASKMPKAFSIDTACYVMLYNVIQRRVMLYSVTWCYIMECGATECYMYGYIVVCRIQVI